MKFKHIYKAIFYKLETSQFLYDSSDCLNSMYSMTCMSAIATTNTQHNYNDVAEDESICDDRKSTIIKSTGLNDTDLNQACIFDDELKHNYDRLYKIINDIYGMFFEKESELELNISERIMKKIRKNLQLFNENYEKLKSNQSYSQDKLNCEKIFDEAHRESLETLYHNVYNNFLSFKRNGGIISGNKEYFDDTISIKRSMV